MKESKMVDSDSTEGLCGEKLAAEFCNFHEMCMKTFKDYAEEVSKTHSLQKRLKPKPIIISKKQKNYFRKLLIFYKRRIKNKNWGTFNGGYKEIRMAED